MPSPAAPLRMIVLRHSDSCTEDSTLKDHDRPLTAWGRELASGLGRNLNEAGWAAPDLVLCSASQRSRETLKELVRVAGGIASAETHFLGSLYTFAAMDGVTADHLRETIVAKEEERRGKVRTVMCIGHNKGWEEAASEFAGSKVKLEVANAALLECESAEVATWEEAFAEGSGVKWKMLGVVEHGIPDQAAPPECEALGFEASQGDGPTPMPSV